MIEISTRVAILAMLCSAVWLGGIAFLVGRALWRHFRRSMIDEPRERARGFEVVAGDEKGPDERREEV